MHGIRAFVVPSLLLAVATLSCSPQMNPGPSATADAPESSGETFTVRTAAGHEISLQPIHARETVVRAATPPSGAFQTTPPASGDQVIRVLMDDVVGINGARFSPANPDDELKIEVEWGDGQSSVSGCGPCRVDHVYRPGRYDLTVTIHDRRAVDRGSVTQTFTVIVQGPPEPDPVSAALPSNCHTLTKPNGACPTGATTFCVSGPVIEPASGTHALVACNACFGPETCRNFNVTCFGNPTTSFQAAVNLSSLDVGFVFARSSATGPVPGETSNFLLAGCSAAGRWAQ
jgi:hypothetical protein